MTVAPCPEDVTAGVASALSNGHPHLVLERLPRAAGDARWWVVASVDDFQRVYRELRPGGRVHLVALGDDVRLGTPDSLAGEFDALGATTLEVVFGTPRPASLEYDVGLLDRSEVAEALPRLPKSSSVLYGVWPRSEVLRFTPPDEDGEVRPQPV